MAYHPKDGSSNNPRIQCPVCAKWMRLYKADVSLGEHEQRFYGGCGYTNGDHYPAGKNDHCVCDECCHKHCKPKAIADGKWQEPNSN